MYSSNELTVVERERQKNWEINRDEIGSERSDATEFDRIGWSDRSRYDRRWKSHIECITSFSIGLESDAEQQDRKKIGGRIYAYVPAQLHPLYIQPLSAMTSWSIFLDQYGAQSFSCLFLFFFFCFFSLSLSSHQQFIYLYTYIGTYMMMINEHDLRRTLSFSCSPSPSSTFIEQSYSAPWYRLNFSGLANVVRGNIFDRSIAKERQYGGNYLRIIECECVF